MTCGAFFADATKAACQCTREVDHVGSHYDARPDAIRTYRAARDEWLRLGDLSDATFKRYFLKLQNGERTNGAACARMDNRLNYASTVMYSAQGDLYRLGLDPWDIDDEDGVEHTPVGS